MKLDGGYVVVISGSRGMGLAAARLATDAVAEVTSASRSPEELVQAQQELGQVHTIVMDTTDEGTIEKGFAGLWRADHGRLSAGTIRNGSMDTLTTLRHER